MASKYLTMEQAYQFIAQEQKADEIVDAISRKLESEGRKIEDLRLYISQRREAVSFIDVVLRYLDVARVPDKGDGVRYYVNIHGHYEHVGRYTLACVLWKLDIGVTSRRRCNDFIKCLELNSEVKDLDDEYEE